MMTFEELWASRRPDLVREQCAECQAEWFWIGPPKGLKNVPRAKKRRRRKRK